MTLDTSGILDGIVSPLLSTGLFENVNTQEPATFPGSGLYASVWIDYIGPAPIDSGLSSTSGLLKFKIRLMTSLQSLPTDMIDPSIIAATDVVLSMFSSGFTLGGRVRNVDLLGATGTSLSCQSGYLRIDGTVSRIVDITLPLIINDLWGQTP